MTTESDPSGPSPPARDADPIGDLLARMRELEAQVAELSDTRRRSYFGLHHPMDTQESTYPPRFDPPVIVDGEPLPLPPPSVRAGYAPNDDALYLRWGKFDHDFILSIAGRYLELQNPLGILDFGCSSGRVLRHFETERQSAGWRPHGVDAQAMLIEWMRSFWPPAYDVSTANVVLPVLPFEDNYFDVIFGISVFTHIKYLWDGWLCELRRCLKPGGLCLQTVHCEEAWSLYARGDAEWQVAGVPDHVRQHPAMDVDYLLFNKSTTSNTFFRRSVVAKLFGRYMAVREVLDPPEFSFQHWVVMQKEGLRTDLAADKLAPMRGIAGQPDPPMPGPAPGPPTAELDPDRHAAADRIHLPRADERGDRADRHGPRRRRDPRNPRRPVIRAMADRQAAADGAADGGDLLWQPPRQWPFPDSGSRAGVPPRPGGPRRRA